MATLMGKRLADVDTWPDLRLTVHLWPWCWKIKPRVYVDDVDGWRGHCSFNFLFLDIEWWGSVPMFFEGERKTPTMMTGSFPITPGAANVSLEE